MTDIGRETRVVRKGVLAGFRHLFFSMIDFAKAGSKTKIVINVEKYRIRDEQSLE